MIAQRCLSGWLRSCSGAYDRRRSQGLPMILLVVSAVQQHHTVSRPPKLTRMVVARCDDAAQRQHEADDAGLLLARFGADPWTVLARRQG